MSCSLYLLVILITCCPNYNVFACCPNYLLFCCAATMETEAKTTGGQTQWSSSQSAFVLTFLQNIVADGTKTATGFKKAQLNECAKALNEHFKLSRTGDQIANHLKT